MLRMLWEGGWEWTTLIISSEIWSFSFSFSFIPTPYIYILLLPPSGGMLAPYLLLSLLRPLKICIPFVAVLKKSKKRQAKTLLLQNRSTPIALAARSAGFFSSSIFQFSIKNLSFRSWLSLKSRKNVKRKHVFQKFAFGCGLSLKSRKNVKRKHYFWKFGAPLSHFRPLGGIFCFLGFSSFWFKTYHSVRGCP